MDNYILIPMPYTLWPYNSILRPASPNSTGVSVITVTTGPRLTSYWFINGPTSINKKWPKNPRVFLKRIKTSLFIFILISQSGTSRLPCCSVCKTNEKKSGCYLNHHGKKQQLFQKIYLICAHDQLLVNCAQPCFFLLSLKSTENYWTGIFTNQEGRLLWSCQNCPRRYATGAISATSANTRDD